MFTYRYKGFFIHGYCAGSACRFGREFERTMPARSVHAAKCRITRQINQAKGQS